MAKPSAPTTKPTTTTPAAPADNGLAIAALVLGIVSLTGFGLLTGIPAIIFGILALRRGMERGMSLAGLITGSIGTFFSLIFIVIMIVAIVISATTSDYQQGHQYDYPDDSSSSPWQTYDQSRT